jgi:DNA-binding beta-propeller fold protein YncE
MKTGIDIMKKNLIGLTGKAKSGLQILMVGLLFCSSQVLFGQASNADFERIKVSDGEVLFSGIALSPDGNNLAISAKQSSPVKIMDWESRKVVKEFAAGNWYSGSKISYSQNGKYLLLQELNYVDFSQNKDRQIGFEIIDAASGNQIKIFEKVQDVVISSDEKYAISLSGDEVTFWNLPSATKEKSFIVPNAANTLAISPDGITLAVSHSITKAELKGDSRFHKRKKAAKFAVKYKQFVSFYDARNFAKITSVSEIYDIIYKLKYSHDGNFVFNYQIPHVKAVSGKSQITTINMIDATTKEPLRKGFTSQSIGQPEIKLSNDGTMFAVNSRGNKFQEIHLYDYESGTMLKRFELGYRLFEKSEGEKFVKDSRPSFTFLPGDKSILITFGNRLVQWNLEFDE